MLTFMWGDKLASQDLIIEPDCFSFSQPTDAMALSLSTHGWIWGDSSQNVLVIVYSLFIHSIYFFVFSVSTGLYLIQPSFYEICVHVLLYYSSF